MQAVQSPRRSFLTSFWPRPASPRPLQLDEALGFDLLQELAPLDAIHRACSAVAGVLGGEAPVDAEQAVGRLFSAPAGMRWGREAACR